MLKTAAKAFYFQRLSIPLEAKYAGKWERKAGQPETEFPFHESFGRTDKIISSKGWIDAGDYNRYMVNSGITTAQMMALIELYPDLLHDNSTNIPESGNGKNDLLDEIKFNLDWMLTMQDSDGGVFVKLTQKNFTGFVMPEDDKDQRFVVGKSTASALNFAASMAMASRIYEEYDSSFSQKCIISAENAWKWAGENPSVFFKNPEDVKTGEYGDADLSEELLWAAAELAVTTGKCEYKKTVSNKMGNLVFVNGDNWRKYNKNLAYHTIAVTDNKFCDEIKCFAKDEIIRIADSLSNICENSPYLVDLPDFQWGSNSDFADVAISLMYGYYLTKDKKYLKYAVSNVDYLFGKNAVGVCFVTGFGSKPSNNIHHRTSGADNIDEAIPGFLVGGPNQYKHDKEFVKYKSDMRAMSYLDETGSWASNEVAINWNAALVFVLGFLEMNM